MTISDTARIVLTRASARLQYDLGRFLFGKEGFHLGASELTPRHRAFIRVDTMQREHVFGRINSNAFKPHLDGPSLVFDSPALARDAVGPSTPTNLVACDSSAVSGVWCVGRAGR